MMLSAKSAIVIRRRRWKNSASVPYIFVSSWVLRSIASLRSALLISRGSGGPAGGGVSGAASTSRKYSRAKVRSSSAGVLRILAAIRAIDSFGNFGRTTSRTAASSRTGSTSRSRDAVFASLSMCVSLLSKIGRQKIADAVVLEPGGGRRDRLVLRLFPVVPPPQQAA